MADLSITAANVLRGSNATIDRSSDFGEAVTAGKVVYKSSSTGKWMLADNNSATAAVRHAHGIALNGGADGQPAAVQTSGDITVGGTLTAGAAYYLSDTPGGICLIADLASGEYYCLLGLAKSAAVLALDIQYPGVSA